MSKKGILYVLLVLGLAVIGGGIWMLLQSPPEIVIPEGKPVIYEQLDYVMRGQFSYLYFYLSLLNTPTMRSRDEVLPASF